MNTTNALFFGRRLAAVFAVALALALCAGSANAQTATYESVAGAWWFSLGGKDEGALLIEFSEPIAGSFVVRDIVITNRASFGFSRALRTFFVIGSGQPLAFDSKGEISGTLALTDGNTPAGQIVIEKGKPNKKFTSLKLRGTVGGEGLLPVSVKLDGVRVPESFAVLTGRSTEAQLSGKGVKSKAYQLTVRTDLALGLPAYDFTGAGPAEIDKIEETNVPMIGRVMLAPNNRVLGLLDESADFGAGVVKGKLSLPKNGTVPRAEFEIQADRKFKVSAKLSQAIEPVLSVQPKKFDFGAVRLDETGTQVFEVENIGVGQLSGEAAFMSGSSSAFRFLGASSYSNLEPNDPPFEITVEFAPSDPAEAKAQIFFGVDNGAGAKIVKLEGVGGVPELEVVPATGVFGSVVLRESRTIPFTIKNDGDGVLTGTALLSGSPDYALVLSDSGSPVRSIPYTIDPGEELIVRVRLTPKSTGQRLSTLRLDGDLDATVALTGTGVTIGF